MTDPSAPASKSRKWLKRLLKVVAALVVLLVVFYFFATSAFFLRHFILPSASKSLGAEITVEDASISPFSHVELHGVKVQTTGAEPLATVQDVKLVYNLRA
ncbi:MAG TPA: hypothetical protein VFC07_00890, partial [Verrucomicrobiae bacterium]|nr:hypothetical protein [Verrucomicrobiae bacterium]